MHRVIVVHYILIYSIVYYGILRFIVLRGIVLYDPSLTASCDGSFFDRIHGRISKWDVDWPIRPLIYRVDNRQVEAFTHTFILSPIHSFGDWSIC